MENWGFGTSDLENWSCIEAVSKKLSRQNEMNFWEWKQIKHCIQ